MKSLDTLDWIVISLYFLILLGIAWWVILQKNKNTTDYFLAGRNVGWFVVGASIFASNIGSEHVVGLAGNGAGDKLPLLIYELHSWVVLMLGWLFLPFYARSKVFTMPEFLEKRFDSRSRWLLSIVSIIAYVLTKVSVTIYAGGIVVSSLLGIPFWIGALSTVVLTGLYTILGGMRAVVYTEAVQAIVLLLGAATLTILGLQEIGGWSGMVQTVSANDIDYMSMWRPNSDPDFPWLPLVITSTIVGIWYWCTDQVIVQRVLTAKNLKEARRGTIFGAFLKITPVFLFLVPGIIALGLSMRGEISFDSPDQAFPVLMTHLLPSGLRGLVAAGLMAALMSSLASVFNSCSTLFTLDIYKRLHPDKPEKQLVNIGKIATTIVVILGIVWIPVITMLSSGLYEYLQKVQSYLAPPIAAVFLLGIFWKRINANGSIAALGAGLVLGMGKLMLETFKNAFSPDSWIYKFADFNWLTFGALFFLTCVLIAIVVSMFTAKPSEEHIEGLTFATTSEEHKNENKASYNWKDIAASLVILAIIAWVMISFS